MNKTRVIPCLLVNDLVLVKTIKFDSYRPIGIPRPAVRIFNAREVDEMVIFDIQATHEGRGPSLDLVAELAEECFMPLTIGGGLRSVEDIREVLKAGADKVAVNAEALRRPELIREAADMFGSQCVVVSIDARRSGDGRYEVFARSAKEATGLTPVDWAKRAEGMGAGEVFLQSVDQDGTMEGYDLELTDSVADAVRVPVVTCGGVGKLQDFVDGVLAGHACAVAAASVYQYTEVTPRMAKQTMREAGIDVRL